VFVLASLLGVVNAFDIPDGNPSCGYGGQGRLDERDRAQFFHVQRRARGGSGGGRNSGGQDWRRLVLLRNAVSYIAVIIGLLLMKVHSPARALMASPLEHIMEGFRFGQPHRADPGVADAVGSGESGGDALRGIDANFRRQDFARWCAGIGHPDGRDRRWSFVGRAHAGFPRRRERAGALGWRCAARVLERVWLCFRSHTVSGFL